MSFMEAAEGFLLGQFMSAHMHTGSGRSDASLGYPSTIADDALICHDEKCSVKDAHAHIDGALWKVKVVMVPTIYAYSGSASPIEVPVKRLVKTLD